PVGARRARLVVTQRDQRRDDHAAAFEQHRRQLVCQRLARAGRHHRQRRSPGQHTLDHLPLHAAEALEAEHAAQRALGRFDRFGTHRAAVPEPRALANRGSPPFCRFLETRARLASLGRGGGAPPADPTPDMRLRSMKKFALTAFASAAALGLAACGDSGDASEDAMADNVEMPADDAMADVPDPAADAASVADAAGEAEESAQDAVDAAEAAGAAAEEAAADAAAAAEAATQAAEENMQ